MKKIINVVIVILIVSVGFFFFYLGEVKSKVIKFDEGIYTDTIYEIMEMNENLVIKGRGIDVSILKPSSIPDHCVFIVAQEGGKSTAVIEDFTIDCSSGGWYNHGLILNNFKSVEIRNVKFVGGGNAGVGLHLDRGFFVTNCIFDGFNDEAIVTAGGSEGGLSIIEKCTFRYSYSRGVHRPDMFIEAVSTSYNIVRDSSFDNAPKGICIAGCDSHDNLIQRCEFSNFDEAAVYIFLGSLPDCPTLPNYNNYVEDCTFTNCLNDILH